MQQGIGTDGANGRFDKIVSAADAVRLIRAGDTAVTGGIGRIGFPEAVAVALTALRADASIPVADKPHRLSLLYAGGQGDGRSSILASAVGR